MTQIVHEKTFKCLFVTFLPGALLYLHYCVLISWNIVTNQKAELSWIHYVVFIYHIIIDFTLERVCLDAEDLSFSSTMDCSMLWMKLQVFYGALNMVVPTDDMGA